MISICKPCKCSFVLISVKEALPLSVRVIRVRVINFFKSSNLVRLLRMTPNRVISPHVKHSLQTHHVDSTLKRRGNMESRWCVCRVILSGHFFNDGLIYMSSIVAPGKFLTLTFLSYFEILFSSKPDNIESPTMRVVFLLHFWRCSFELGDIWGFFYLFKFLLVFLTKLNKLVLDRNY